MSRVLIIIPAYNEASTIEMVIASIKKELSSADILVVSDGSTDSTAEIARALNVYVVEHPFNLGIGATMQTGYRFAALKEYDVAVQVDGDGQHPADQIKYIVEPVKKGEADVAIGSRFLGEEYSHTLARWVGMKIFSQVISLIVREKVTDTTSGFRAASKKVIQFYSAHYPEDYPEVEAIVLLHKAGFTVREVSVRFEERQGGATSITPLRSVYCMVKVFLAVFVDLMKKIER